MTNLQVAEGLLAPYRMHVDTCMSGFIAIQMVQSKHYHMIFMDHMMPEMDGTETMKRIRELGLSHLSKLPVIALSANAMGNAREFFLKEGFQDYLAKPIEFYQLNHILKTYLRDAQLEQQDTMAISKETNQEQMKECIDGIDMNTAIQALGGTYTAYYMILTTYYEDIGTRRRELPHILERKEFDLFTIYVHAIKSASKSVGAEEISRMALELEMYGKQKQYGEIEVKIASFYQQLDQMIENLNDYFDNKITEQKEKKEWIGVLSIDMREELQKAAVDMDYAALEHIIKNLKNYSFDTKTSIMLESIQEALWDFDYARLESIAMKL
jgi:CheY-like chemotaxis protein